MATDAGELSLKVSADISAMRSSLQDASTQIKGLGVATVAEGIIISDVFRSMGQAAVKFVQDSITAFAQHEETIARLNLLVGTNATEAFLSFANQLQRTTAFSNDTVLSLEQQLAQYGILPGSIRPATQALVDFAAVTGTDLPTAGHMLAQAMAGQSRALKQYGIDVSTTGTRSENLATATAALESKFHSAAETMKGTTLGAVRSLNNSFDDLKKTIGEALSPAVKTFSGILQQGIDRITSAIKGVTGYNDTLEDQRAKLKALMEDMKAHYAMGGRMDQQDKDMITTLVAHINELKKKSAAQKENTGATEREIAAVRSLKDEIARLEQEQKNLGEITQLTIQKNLLAGQLELQQIQANESVITQTTAIETEKRLKTAQDSWEAQAGFSDQLLIHETENLSKTKSDFVNLADTMVDSFSSGISKIVVEGGRMKDMMAQFATQMAEAFIQQVVRMITEWLIFEAITGLFGGGVAMTSTLGAVSHMAGGGMINEPSFLIGMRSGSVHVAGEAGPERVVPSGQSNTSFAGAPSGGGSGGGGGGDVHIHISGQFIEGNPSKWQRLVQEQIVPNLRRFAMKSPNGLINRTRGALS